MSEKSPSIIKGHECAFCEGKARFHHNYWTCINHANFDGVMGIRNQTIADILKIIDERRLTLIDMEDTEDTDEELIQTSLYELNRIKEEIKNLKSQGASNQSGQQVWGGRNSLHKEDEGHQSNHLPNTSEGLVVRGSKNPSYPDTQSQGCGQLFPYEKLKNTNIRCGFGIVDGKTWLCSQCKTEMKS